MDKKIGLFYGTDTGNTEMVAKMAIEKIEAILGANSIDLHEIYQKKSIDMAAYDLIIMGQPTWYDGELQGDWEEFIPEMNAIDFTSKKVAFFGLGDQYGYASYFCDSLGVFAEMVEKLGVSNIKDVALLTENDKIKLSELRGWSMKLVEKVVKNAAETKRRT